MYVAYEWSYMRSNSEGFYV